MGIILLSSCESIAIVGTEASIIKVEVHLGSGLPCFAIVGLPAKSVREAEHRTRAAIESAGASWPKGRKVANLAPGAVRKEGTHFDLSIALAVLQADKQISEEPLEGWVTMGELGLDGSIRPVRGVLAAAITCRKAGRRGIICPAANAREAAIIDDIEVVPVSSLGECIDFVKGEWAPEPIPPGEPHRHEFPPEDMSEVRGHPIARRAAEVAAAGAHNLLLGGPPGSGKTMLARRMPGILPAMSLEESLEVTRVHSVAGLLGEHAALVTRRPFRVPHHHVSLAGLIGGGSGLARPGEVSLAHATIDICF
jgi:magnesium chelatase family protein